MAFGLREAREVVSDAAARMTTAAENTKAAMGALAVLGVCALAVAVIALGLALRGRGTA